MNIKFINEIETDYACYCSQKMKEVDSAYPIPGEQCILDYFRYKFRKITDVKRKVFVNPNLDAPPKYVKAIGEIQKRICEGKSLLKYQSRKLKDTNYDDSLLMDWGVQHLHLGEVVENDGFVQRTEDLLFIKFTDDSAYIINIFNHNQWSEKMILEIIHECWSETIREYKLEGVSDIFPCPDEDMIKQFRDISANIAVKLSDGTCYMGPGGGITLANTPRQVTHALIGIRKEFQKAFEYISKSLKETGDCETITVGLRWENSNLTFYLKELDKGLFYLEPNEPLQ